MSAVKSASAHGRQRKHTDTTAVEHTWLCGTVLRGTLTVLLYTYLHESPEPHNPLWTKSVTAAEVRDCCAYRTYNDPGRSMSVDLVGDFERTTSTPGDFDLVLLIGLEIPVGMRVFGMGEDFSCSERRRSQAAMGQLVRLSRIGGSLN